MIHRYMSRRCSGTALEADDMANEVFSCAWKIWDKRQSDNIKAWLIGIARKVFAGKLRAVKTNKSGGCLEQVEWQEWQDHRPEEANQENFTLLNQIKKAIEDYPEAQKYAIEGLMLELNTKEIADKKGNTTRQAVEDSLKRARKKLAMITE